MPPIPTDSEEYRDLRALADHLPGGFNIDLLSDGVSIGFSTPAATIRYKHSFTEQRFLNRAYQSNQTLLKACSNKQHSIHQVLDLTGGWGVDSFILAHHGRKVSMLEQNSLIYAITAYTLRCAQSTQQLVNTVNRLDRINIDGFAFLNSDQCSGRFECIYMDPMFPSHKSGAKPAKEMQILQKLTENLDIEPCFLLALKKATNRVVVKRPAKSAPFSDLRPDLVYREKTIRLDVYLTRQHQDQENRSQTPTEG